jgi:hypothetical protein
MRPIRAWQLFVDVLWFPICILGGIVGGIVVGFVAWWTKIGLTWRMRNSYYWNEDSPADSAEKSVNIDKTPKGE